MTGKNWYFSSKGKVEGPFTVEQLHSRAKDYSDVLVWNPKLVKWQPMANVFTVAATEKIMGAHSVSPTLPKKAQKKQSIVKSKEEDKESPSNMSHWISHERKAWELKGQAAVSKGLRGFAQKWLELEAQQAREKNALMMELMNEQDEVIANTHNELMAIRKRQLEMQKTIKPLSASKTAQAMIPKETSVLTTQSEASPQIGHEFVYEKENTDFTSDKNSGVSLKQHDKADKKVEKSQDTAALKPSKNETKRMQRSRISETSSDKNKVSEVPTSIIKNDKEKALHSNVNNTHSKDTHSKNTVSHLHVEFFEEDKRKESIEWIKDSELTENALKVAIDEMPSVEKSDLSHSKTTKIKEKPLQKSSDSNEHRKLDSNTAGTLKKAANKSATAIDDMPKLKKDDLEFLPSDDENDMASNIHLFSDRTEQKVSQKEAHHSLNGDTNVSKDIFDDFTSEETMDVADDMSDISELNFESEADIDEQQNNVQPDYIDKLVNHTHHLDDGHNKMMDEKNENDNDDSTRSTSNSEYAQMMKRVVWRRRRRR